jgi:flagellar FliL protein
VSKKKTDDAEAPEEEAKGGKKKLLIIALVAVLAIGAGAYFFLFSGGDEEPVAGEVLPLDSIAVNLAGGGYLKIGIALQLTEDAGEAIDGSKALDLVISTYSQAQPTDVATARDALKESLKQQIVHAYTEGGTESVMDVYLTEYVTQ